MNSYIINKLTHANCGLHVYLHTQPKKLAERLKTPHVAPDRVLGSDNVYKIKLRQSGYRLVYQVLDDVVVVTVLAVGKRERNEAYKKALKRLDAE